MNSRPVCMGDSELLRRWRNDPLTREMSLTNYEVMEGEHALWLDEILRDRTKRLFIVTEQHRDGLSHLGTFRLDGAGSDVVEISLTVAPDWRGVGLATPIIEMAMKEAAILGAKDAVAVVRVENTPSQRAFERAGFTVDFETGGTRYYGRKIPVATASV